jgi:hypothetical protein
MTFRRLAGIQTTASLFYLARFASSEGALNTGSSKLNSHQCDCRPLVMESTKAGLNDRFKKLGAAVTPAHWGYRGGTRIVWATEPSFERRALSDVPDAQGQGNIKKPPLVSHKVAVN